jgi:hypothetical protein
MKIFRTAEYVGRNRDSATREDRSPRRAAPPLRPVAVLVALLLMVLGAQSLTTATASAATTGRVMATTQRMSAATLNSSQNGWYAAGSAVALSCFVRGQSVKGYYSPYIAGGWDNLWYKASDGYFLADVDLSTGSNNPVTGACGSSAPAPAAVSVDTNTWFMLTARNSGKVVDVRGASSSNGTAVQQYSINRTNAQLWRFVSTDSGYYRIVSALNGNDVLDVSGGGTGNGSRVQIWGWAGGTNQQWLPVDAGNGYLTLMPRHVTSRCLDVPGGSTSSSVQLQIWDCNGTASQQYLPTAVGTIGDPRAANAVAWGVSLANARSTSYPGLCEKFVENAYNTTGKYPTAIAAFNSLKAGGAIHTTSTTIPIGALVFSEYVPWDGGSGHVELSEGNGRYVSGGASTSGAVNVAEYDHLSTGFLGWAYAPASWPGR